jgi:hypothetical protein
MHPALLARMKQPTIKIILLTVPTLAMAGPASAQSLTFCDALGTSVEPLPSNQLEIRCNKRFPVT